MSGPLPCTCPPDTSAFGWDGHLKSCPITVSDNAVNEAVHTTLGFVAEKCGLACASADSSTLLDGLIREVRGMKTATRGAINRAEAAEAGFGVAKASNERLVAERDEAMAVAVHLATLVRVCSTEDAKKYVQHVAASMRESDHSRRTDALSPTGEHEATLEVIERGQLPGDHAQVIGRENAREHETVRELPVAFAWEVDDYGWKRASVGDLKLGIAPPQPLVTSWRVFVGKYVVASIPDHPTDAQVLKLYEAALALESSAGGGS